jgi:hypothetical protein
MRNGRFWIEFQPCKDKPNSHAWNTKGSSRSNRLPFIPTRGSEPPQATAGSYALPKCRTYACSATTWPYSWLLLQHVFLHVELSNRKNQNTSGGRYVHSSGRLVTRLTAYHISRHVASTFKCLTTATTHCDLSNFINTDGVSSQPIPHTNPVRHPYSDCRNVNNTTPIKLASDRQSLDFYRSY